MKLNLHMPRFFLKVVVFIALLLLSACQRTLVITPYFDGVRTGDYIYMTEVDGVPAEVTTSATFNVSAEPIDENNYEFEGTLEWLGETYTVTGKEKLPSKVVLKPQVSAFFSDIRIVPVNSNGAQKYIICGEYFYGTGGYFPDFSDNRGATLNVYPITSADVCQYSSEDIVGTIHMPPGTW